jgi:subtilisin-like proprotein convertase family protein
MHFAVKSPSWPGAAWLSVAVLASALPAVGHAALFNVEPAAKSTNKTPTAGVLFEIDAATFAELAAGPGVIDGIPTTKGTSDPLSTTGGISPLGGAEIKIEIVEPTGSRFIDFPSVQQVNGDSLSKSGDEISLYQISGSYYGIAVIDGETHQLSRTGEVSKSGNDLYTFIPAGDDPRPAGWCGTETTPEAIAFQQLAESNAEAIAFSQRSHTRSTAVADQEVDFAIELAYEYVSAFPTTDDSIQYILSVLAEVNNIYVRDIQTQFRVTHLRAWAVPSDPYAGANSSDFLDSIEAEKTNPAAPVALQNADLAHLFTAGLGHGGRAFLSGVCAGGNVATGYSDVGSSYEYPSTGYTWTVDVLAHELGHNMGSSHTHCYVPPIDKCYNTESGCYSGTAIPSEGSILSYCHLASSTRLKFDPRVITVLRAAVIGEACLATPSSGGDDIYENDDVVAEAKPLNDANWQIHSISPVADQDWLTLNFDEWTGVVIETSGASGDTVMTLYDEGMTELLVADDISGGNLFSRIELPCTSTPVPPGRYYLKIEEKGNDAAISEYQVRVTPSYCNEDQYEQDDDFASATPITMGTVQQRNTLPKGDGDYVTFTLPAPTTFTLSASVGSSFRYLQVFLYDSTFAQIDQCASPSDNVSITRNCSSGTTPAGTYYALIIDDNNDQMGDYTLSLLPCSAEVTVTEGGTNIADGSGSVSFGTAQQGGSSIAKNFVVTNYGNTVLNLSGLSVPANYNILEGLSATLATGASDTFTVELATASLGAQNGTISFTTNDPDEGTFDFSVSGTIIAAAPEVEVLDGATLLVDGVSSVDLGQAAVGEAALTRTFTVRNAGLLPINTSGLGVPAGYTISEGLSASIPATTGGTETLNASPATPFGSSPSTLNVPLNFTGVGTINDISVTLNVTHTWDSDMVITLIHPDTTAVTLFNGHGGSGDNLTNTIFADSAVTPISSGTPPYTGSFQPDTPFSALAGKPLAGAWTLRIQDTFSGADDGTLNSYSVSVDYGSVGEDTFTISLPTGTPGTYPGTVSFNNDDGDENPFSFSITGSITQSPTITAFDVDGGSGYTNSNPAPITFAETGTFPATSIEISEDSAFATFSSIPLPAGSINHQFNVGVNGPRTVYARLRNASGTSAVLSEVVNYDTGFPEATFDFLPLARVGPTIDLLNFESTDLVSGVETVSLYVLPPGGSWQFASSMNAISGEFIYTPTNGAGLYDFEVVATDFAGNSEVAPSGSVGSGGVLYNTVNNGAFPRTIAVGSNQSYLFAMKNFLLIEIEFNQVTAPGTVTVQRFENNTNSVGLDPSKLLTERYSITASGGLVFDTATIQFTYENARLNGLNELTQLNTAFRVNGSTVTILPLTIMEPQNYAIVNGVTGFSDWYIGDASAAVADWTLLDE